MIEEKHHVVIEQVHLMYAQTNKSIIGGGITCSILCLILWGVIEQVYILTWLSMVLFALASRWILYRVFIKQVKGEKNIRRWGTIYMLMTFAYGLIIGATSLVIHLVDSPSYHFLVVAWLVAYGSLGVSAYSMSYKAVLSLFSPMITILIISLVSAGSTLYLLTAAAVIVWSFMMFNTMLPINLAMRNAIKLNYKLNIEIERRKEVEKRLLELSSTDGLTGLFNRRYFNEVIAKELSRAKRTDTNISLIFIDIDSFKQFNDTYGHQAGDDTLKKVSNTLSEIICRPSDLAARYGGEELVALLPNTNSINAFNLAEKIRMQVQELSIPHSESRSNNSDYVSISVGIATLGFNAYPYQEDIIFLADKALYKAKEAGRNNTIIA